MIGNPLNTDKNLSEMRQFLARRLDDWETAKASTIQEPGPSLYNLVRATAEELHMPEPDVNNYNGATGFYATIGNLELRASLHTWRPASVRVRQGDYTRLVYQASEGGQVRVYRPGLWEDELRGMSV